MHWPKAVGTRCQFVWLMCFNWILDSTPYIPNRFKFVYTPQKSVEIQIRVTCLMPTPHILLHLGLGVIGQLRSADCSLSVFVSIPRATCKKGFPFVHTHTHPLMSSSLCPLSIQCSKRLLRRVLLGAAWSMAARHKQ